LVETNFGQHEDLEKYLFATRHHPYRDRGAFITAGDIVTDVLVSVSVAVLASLALPLAL
jgi:hypothetical protein